MAQFCNVYATSWKLIKYRNQINKINERKVMSPKLLSSLIEKHRFKLGGRDSSKRYSRSPVEEFRFSRASYPVAVSAAIFVIPQMPN